MIFETREALTPESVGADVAFSDGFSVCEVHARYGWEIIEGGDDGWQCCCASTDSYIDKALFRRMLVNRGIVLGVRIGMVPD